MPPPSLTAGASLVSGMLPDRPEGVVALLSFIRFVRLSLRIPWASVARSWRGDPLRGSFLYS
jgi:hypothetical protein